jgi:hypothetical protein
MVSKREAEAVEGLASAQHRKTSIKAVKNAIIGDKVRPSSMERGGVVPGSWRL